MKAKLVGIVEIDIREGKNGSIEVWDGNGKLDMCLKKYKTMDHMRDDAKDLLSFFGKHEMDCFIQED